MLGYNEQELIGRNSHAIWHHSRRSGEAYPLEHCPIHSTLKAGKPFRGEDCFIRRDGTLFDVEVSCTPMYAGGIVSGAVITFRDIEERKKADQELHILKLAMEQSPVSMVITDAEGTIQFVNPKFTAATGYTSEEAVGENPRLLKSGEFPKESYQELWNTISSGRTWHGHFHNKRKNGELYWEDAIISPVMDGNGTIHHYFALKEDITERKRMQELMRLQSQAMDSAPGYILICDALIPDQPIIYANQAFEILTGYSKSEVVGKNPRFLQGVNKHQTGLEEIRRGLRENAPSQVLIQNYRKDGSLFWNDLRVAPVLDDKGQISHYVGISNIVTDFVEIQEQLRKNEERLRLAQEYADIGTWDLNIKTNELYWSEKIGPLFGYPEGDIKATYERFLDAVHPEDRQSVHSTVQHCIDTGDAYQIEHRCVWPDGSIHWLQENGNISSDKKGDPTHMLGLIQDITARKNAEEALRRSMIEANRANQAKSLFLSSMSHELRTPMNAILGFGQLLEMESSLDPAHLDFIQEIIKAGHHLLELINDVLDLARIESGKVDLMMESISCVPLVDECLNLVRPLASKQNITINSTCPPELTVRADRMRLKQVLINILSNAIKYNTNGGSVAVRVSARDGKIRFSISDTGRGIAKERMSELFAPFNRLGLESSDIEGTGIGLTISKQLVELMGGWIGATSEPGTGSRFWIDLKQEYPADRDTQTVKIMPETMEPADSRRTFSILYIEDNPANLRLVERILEKRGHIRLIEAHTPALGLELAAIHLPDLILMDLGMRDMDGFEVLRLVRESDWGRSMPVMAISAYAMANDIEKGLAAGFVEYLTKPLDIRRFLDTIDRVLTECATHSTTDEGIP
ncbi:MAG: hypothetical protein A2Y38_19300 [Spirochaetes bacterium GWB1_59_5]|nr:MAG: hypothetical protein A2Y38_19300 [Spirochaetes bacterium GWB1_59_5]